MLWQLLTAVAVGLASGGLVTAVWGVIRDRKKEPVEVRDAHVAAADTVNEMALRTAEAAQEAAKRAQAEAEQCKTRIAELEASHNTMRHDLREQAEENLHLADQNVALVDYIVMLTTWVAEGHVVQYGWPPIPPKLRDRLTTNDLPPVPTTVVGRDEAAAPPDTERNPPP